MTTDETFQIRTRRPQGGALVLALGNPVEPASALAEAVLTALDAGEGWTSHDDECWWWYPSRLAVRLLCEAADLAPVVRADIRVVTGAVPTEDLFRWLSDLNAHAAGWWWWLDTATGDVHCSITCLAQVEAWWWPSVLLCMLPHAVTVADAMADELARASRGSICNQEHPQRGARGNVDGWLPGVRLGPRDLTASLDLRILDGELARLDAALDVICSPLQHQQWQPLHVCVADASGEPRIVLRRHWHPQQGWGWQFATVSAFVASSSAGAASLRALAAQLNAAQAVSTAPVNRFGGWTYADGLGLAHLTFVPAFVLDSIMADAGPTIGDVAALMLDPHLRLADLEIADALPLPNDVERRPTADGMLDELGQVGWKTGPIGWSYVDPNGRPPQPTKDVPQATWTDLVPAALWTTPRHLPLCSFGIFNPMGPTVSSLEVALVPSTGGALAVSLYLLMRHPHLPEAHWLGDAEDLDGLAALVTETLADPEGRVLGNGPEWLDVFAEADALLAHAVLAGVRCFASAREDVDWRATADDLVRHAINPWARVSEHEAPLQSSPWPAEADPIDCWIEAITDDAVIAGHQLFLRSAWEGAKAYRQSDWDPSAAQQAADAARAVAEERIDAELVRQAAPGTADADA